MVQPVASGMFVDAFRAEAERLSETVSGTDEASFTRPSPCPPWTAGELLYHVRIALGRVPGMLAEPEPTGARWYPRPTTTGRASDSHPRRTPAGSQPRRRERRPWLPGQRLCAPSS
jgi:Mycothiol maleylpyruvate isomerase N-terminal domain